MKDASFELSKAYAVLLTGLTYNGKPVKVYDGMAPATAVAPYVIVGPWVQLSDNSKTSFGQKGEINLDIVTRFNENLISKKPANDIANLITELLKPTPSAEVLSLDSFDCWNTVIVGENELSATSDTDRIFRKIITVSHSLCQR